MNMIKRLCVVVLLLGLVLSACGDDDDENEDGEGLRGEQPCLDTPAPIEDPMLPTPFPEIDDVTWTATNAAGPSRVVNGYTSDALDDLFEEMKEKFETEGYSVTKSEHDPHDAEVNFSSDNNSGQVRLGEECQGRRSVTITIRPQ
jgi:hypothetical protein